ncbi:Gfo/Idh/MocA family protein [Jiangella rhizosphaerae]|uniref:Gfo/Idh/MocA family oxidoreductase n=1 Tax=Jiangella rhizosphaerae TaxID=2293569 RepID=A0A418KH54_9ACTN|nr:Gfo/Idh/MocA family oxidoreductase [Jiangella rhizosphaerae]RIQ11455.1 gfo/Idh/MocA family oxidoreductase [Jiangella rhizosphaerae]
MTRYAIAGLSNRGVASFVRPILGSLGGADTALGYGENAEDYSDHADVVAVVDPDEARVTSFNETLLPPGHAPLAWYSPDDFDRMVDEARPDVVVVASPDHTHAAYTLAALRRDVDVIVEKPMVTTAADAAAVLAAEQASKATVRVTHNLRYTLRHRTIKRLILDGAIGRPTHVSLDYHVDIRHGASFFLRWNRRRELSGGLSVHKSTHHLDLVSWWLDDVPERVFALGGRYYYGPDSPHRPRDERGEPLAGATLREQDPYYRAQLGSNTFPDGSGAGRVGLFGLSYGHQYPAGQDMYLYDDEIDVEDTYSALVAYRGGVALSYTIDFSSPWEGYRVAINGTHGQIETLHGRLPGGGALPGSGEISHRPLFGEARAIEVAVVAGGHEGADPLLRHDLFVGPGRESQELGLLADSADGARAVAAGEAIWRSIATGDVIDVDGLLTPPE